MRTRVFESLLWAIHAIKYSFLGATIFKHSKKISRMFHFSHNSQRRRAIEVAIRLDSHNVCNEQPHQMNRKQSARTQQNSSKMKHAFTASLNGTTHRMPSHWPVSVAITIISIKWLSNNYIINSFYFLFFVQRCRMVFVSFFAVCCRHLYACRQLNARNVHSVEVNWLTQHSSSG